MKSNAVEGLITLSVAGLEEMTEGSVKLCTMT